MKSPQTASPKNSIWKSVGQRAFWDAVSKLKNLKPVPIECSHPLPEHFKEDSIDRLPFEEELQLADDFAFIAAYEFGVDYVTTAAIEVQPRFSGLVIRLAANEGVADCVVEKLDAIAAVLKRCADKRIPRPVCAEEIFEIVVDLDSNRVLGRLDSRWYEERGFRNSKGPPTKAFRNALVQLAPFSCQGSVKYTELLSQTIELDDAFQQIEQSQGRPKADTLRSLIKSAFALTIDGLSLRARTDELQIKASVKLVESIGKIANYWRVSAQLAEFSRSYRGLFRHLQIERLEHFECHYVPNTRHKQFVHAEIQLVVHYETSSCSRPRVIGSSKKACFLCNAFIQAHGRFFVSKAHRQVYKEWYVPDLVGYSKETMERMRTTIAAVHQDVKTEIKITQIARACGRPSVDCPNQSAINMIKLTLPAPSTSSNSSAATITSLPLAPNLLETFVAEAGTNGVDEKSAKLALKDMIESIPEGSIVSGRSINRSNTSHQILQREAENTSEEERQEHSVLWRDEEGIDAEAGDKSQSNGTGQGTESQVSSRGSSFTIRPYARNGDERETVPSTREPTSSNCERTSVKVSSSSEHESVQDYLEQKPLKVSVGDRPLIFTSQEPDKHYPFENHCASVSPYQSAYLQADSIALYASFDSVAFSTQPNLLNASASESDCGFTPKSSYSRGNVTLKVYKSGSEGVLESGDALPGGDMQRIDVSMLQLGEELVLRRRTDDVEKKLEFCVVDSAPAMLGAESHTERGIRVVCEWIR